MKTALVVDAISTTEVITQTTTALRLAPFDGNANNLQEHVRLSLHYGGVFQFRHADEAGALQREHFMKEVDELGKRLQHH